MDKKIKLHHGILFSSYRKSEIKKKILKEARGNKQHTYRRTKIVITSDFSSETILAKGAWSEILSGFFLFFQFFTNLFKNFYFILEHS